MRGRKRFEVRVSILHRAVPRCRRDPRLPGLADGGGLLNRQRPSTTQVPHKSPPPGLADGGGAALVRAPLCPYLFVALLNGHPHLPISRRAISPISRQYSGLKPARSNQPSPQPDQPPILWPPNRSPPEPFGAVPSPQPDQPPIPETRARQLSNYEPENSSGDEPEKPPWPLCRRRYSET